MNREIKFRAWDNQEKEMNTSGYIGAGSSSQNVNIGLDGFITISNSYGLMDGSNPAFDKPLNERFELMQFTGLKDKNGKEVFEGDVIKYYTLHRYVQQSHAEVSPEIDELYIKENVDRVVFKDGAFQLSKWEDDWFIPKLSECGLYDVAEVIEQCGCVDEETTDINGNEINESILGFEVIGNQFENPELLNPLPSTKH